MSKNVYVYVYVYVYIYIYIYRNIYIVNILGGKILPQLSSGSMIYSKWYMVYIYIFQKVAICSLWTVCPCFIQYVKNPHI